ncbi:MAG: host attachment protein [Betaproteobacteria bacterium]|nr:host attachment protein [Betaproteobacteria bacterium]
MATWILTANASTARLYSNLGPNKGLQLVREFDHPESREKALNLVSDRPGHNQGHGNGHGSYVPATDPKSNEADRFAQELARELEQGRATNGYDRLILLASTPFIGMLNARLTERVRALVTERIEKDYTRATEKELSAYLEPYIFL